MAPLLSRLLARSDTEKDDYERIEGSEPSSPIEARQHRPRRRSRLCRIFLGRGWIFWVTILAMGMGAGALLSTREEHKTVKATMSSLAGTFRLGTPAASCSPPSNFEAGDFNPSQYLNGPAGNTFRDALKPNLKYITTWHAAGMTNDVMMYCNLIYLAILTRRIPVIPPFEPASQHIGQGGYSRNFGAIFDVPRLAAELNYPILEWADIKRARYNEPRLYKLPPLDGVEEENINCWDTGMTYFNRSWQPYIPHADLLKLNITSVGVPEWTSLEMRHGKSYGYFGSLTGLARLLLPEARPGILRSPTLVKPDDHLACVNVLYYTAVRQAFEWEQQITPVWDLVGTRLHYTSTIEGISKDYIRRVFGLPEDEDPLPPFISVHIRRTDFKDRCKGQDMNVCMASLASYERRVNQVQAELIRMFGEDSPQATASQRILVASDENDPAWWESVREKGWKFVDHEKEQTSVSYGAWYPTLIDSAIQGMSVGFVGTAGSTFSMISAYRARDWNGGVSKMVYFGRPGEDEKHQRRDIELNPEMWE